MSNTFIYLYFYHSSSFVELVLNVYLNVSVIVTEHYVSENYGIAKSIAAYDHSQVLNEVLIVASDDYDVCLCT